MILKRPAKRRRKFIYYDGVRNQLSTLADVFDMIEAPPGTNYFGFDENNGRGPEDTDERKGDVCVKGRETLDRDDHWKVGYKRDGNEFEDNDIIPGRGNEPYSADSIRWSEEDWLLHEQA